MSACGARTTAGRTSKGVAAIRPTRIPIYSYPAQRSRRVDHRRLRLSRHAVPEQLPGQLLLRRLHAELDQASDVRRERNVNGVFNFEPADGPPTGPTATSCISPRGPTARSTTSTSATRTSVVLRRQQDPPDQLHERQPGADRGRVGEPDRRAGAAGRQLLERGLVGSRRPAADVLVDVRRQHHVDSGQSEAHVLAAGPVLGAALGLGRREYDALDAANRSASEARRRQPSCRRRTAASSSQVTSSPSRGRQPTRRTARCLPARSPGRSTSCTKAMSIPACPSPASRAGRSRSPPAVTTSAATPGTGSRLTVTDSTGLTDTRSVTVYPAEGESHLRHGAGRPDRLRRRHRRDDAVRLRHAGRLQPHCRGRATRPWARPRTRSGHGRTAGRKPTRSSCQRSIELRRHLPGERGATGDRRLCVQERSGTSAANASGSGLLGTLTNGATWGRVVMLARCCSMVRTTSSSSGNPALQLTGSMTLSAWINSVRSRSTMRRSCPSVATGRYRLSSSTPAWIPGPARSGSS